MTIRDRDRTARTWTGRRSAAISSDSSASTWRPTSRRTWARNRSGRTSKATGSPPATSAELDAMKKLVAQAMEEGAMGLSTALLEPPSSLATTDNLDRAGEGRQAIRRHLCLAHPRRGGTRFSGRRRGDPGREGREHPGGHPPHEDRAQEAVGSRQRDHRDGPEGARRGPHRDGERLSLHGRPEQSVVDHSAVGARRRARTDGRTPARSGRAAAHARRNPERAARTGTTTTWRPATAGRG